VSKLPLNAKVQLMREGINTSLKEFIALSSKI
jgi:hypothetical protein